MSSQLPVFSVSDLTALTNQILETAFPQVIVEGEVANFKVSKGKYVYFDIKDDEASINCFMMIYQLQTEVRDGFKVRLLARPQLTTWGRFSLVVRDVELAGEGSIKKAFEQLRRRLEAEGLFEVARKRSLPRFPESVALVTSAESAAYHDFTKILAQRWGGVTVHLADVQVQGMSAPQQLADAIAYCNTLSPEPEVLVIIRGGGSTDDLQAFSSEMVVRAIAQSRIPNLVAIGHEQDMSLAELAADLRASTPSNAAELLVPDKQEMLLQLAAHRSRLEWVTHNYFKHLSNHLLHTMTILDQQGSFESQSRYLTQLSSRLVQAPFRRIDVYRERLQNIKQLLNSYDPRMVLRRGYALVRAGEIPVHDVRLLQIGQLIMVELAHGKLEAQIKTIQAKSNR